MPRFISICLLVALMCLASSALAQEGEGQRYTTLPVQTKLLGPEKTEAVMFFWYGCGGCYRVIQEEAAQGEGWPQGATLVRMPALGNPLWTFHGQIYLALESLNVPFATHLAVFDALQNKHLRVVEREDLPALVQVLGIDGGAFMQAFDSAEVAAKMDEINRVSAAYNIDLVPTMVVEGKYKFDLGMVNSADDFIRLAEELIAKSAADK